MSAKYPRDGYRWIACTIYCGRQWLSIDITHNLMWSAMAINGHRYDIPHHLLWSAIMAVDRSLAQHIVAGNGHRSTSRTIYCGLQRPSMDVVIHLLCSVMSVGRQYHQSIDVDNNSYRHIPSSIYCRRQYTSIDSPPHLSLKQ